MRARLELYFPALARTTYEVTSEATSAYNCIAWAAHDDTRWWWPDALELYFWPPGVPRSETIESFARAFALQGYEPCSDPLFEPGVEKVALYTKAGQPTHTARQLPDGSWTSKLGQLEDIQHGSTEDVAGLEYGQAALYLRRRSGS